MQRDGICKKIVPAKVFIQFTKTSTKHNLEHQDQL